ncbi:hypothetical protein CRG98_003653 [Punica granatum]|uniref:Uncharacterized protein n=1 Tax=Punica granatum TaxID=22663 RepID=A0A2I0L5F5_PUNGR|nr:hypothetical protein CRG98_003653 [Punica granatum]
MRCMKVRSNRLADPARLQVARARWLGKLAVQENTARFQEARARWLAELAVLESNLARVSRPDRVPRGTNEMVLELAVQEIKLPGVTRPGMVARGTNEVGRRTCGGLQGCKRHERGRSADLRCKIVNSHGLVDPARLQEARARLLGELAVHESKLARVTRPGMVARGTNEVGRRTCGGLQGCKRHERGRSADLRCKIVNSHGLVDPARLQEARARLLGELAVQEIKLARVEQVSRPGKVARGTSEVVRRTCGA